MTRPQDPYFPEPDFQPPAQPPLASEARAWIAAAHLVPLAYFLVWWIPGSAFVLVVPLAILRFKRHLDPLVADQAREAFDFHLFVAALSFALCITVLATVLVPILWIAALVFAILASSRACEGERYRYPFVWRLLPHDDGAAHARASFGAASTC